MYEEEFNFVTALGYASFALTPAVLYFLFCLLEA